MQYFLLFIVIIMCTAQTVLTKQYNVSAKEINVFSFSAVSSFAALAFFVVSGGFQFAFAAEYIPYSIGFAAAYTTSGIANFLAIHWGSMSITNLVSSYSLLIPTVYGLIALQEKLSAVGIVGVVCLLVSIFLINDSKEKASFSFKWIVALVFAFVAGGMCSTVQKMQQVACDGAYKSDFMVVALVISTCAFAAAAVLKKEKVKNGFAICTGFGAMRGVANGIVNLLVMVLAGSIPNAILFPSVSAGGIVLGFIMAVTVYKERLSRQQLIGYVIGTVSVILLNL